MQIKIFTFPGPAASSVTQDGITYTFKNPVQTRQTADGAWAVEMGTEVTYVDPPATGTGQDLRNGLMLNPLVDWDPNHTGKAWDGRDGINMSLEQTGNLPIVLNANDVLVKGISATDAELQYVSGDPTANSADRKGWCKNSSALYAVADINSLPSASITSPAPIGWTGRGDLEFWTVDAAAAVAALAEYDTTILPASVNFADSESSMSKFQAMATYSFRSTAGGYQAWYMFETTSDGNFGRELYETQEPVLLSILGNEWTDEQKQTRMIQFASTGVHFLQVAAGSPDYVASWPDGLGAHYQYTKVPVLMARLACAGEPTADNPPVYPLDNVYEEVFVFDEDLISRITTPHTSNSSSRPREAFERPVDAVDTINDTITVAFTYPNDLGRPAVTRSCKIIAIDGSHESLVRGGSFNFEDTLDAAVIGVYDAGAFAGKNIRIEAVSPFKVDDVWWKAGRTNLGIQSEPNIFYSDQNDYSGWAMLYLASGLPVGDALPAIRWTEMRDEGFRGYNGGEFAPFQTQFAREFWGAHKDAVFAASSVSPGTFSAIPFPIFDDDWTWSIGESTGEVVVTLEALDERNGPATDVEYSTDGSTWSSFPSFSGLGSYTINLGGANARPNLQLRAVNAEGVAEVTPGIKVETGPANVATAFPVPEGVTTYFGSGPHEVSFPGVVTSGDVLVLEIHAQQQTQISSVPGFVKKGPNIFERVADETEGSSVTFSYSERAVVICRRFSGAFGIKVSDQASSVDAPLVSLHQFDKYTFVAVVRGDRSDWNATAEPSGYGNLTQIKSEVSSAESRLGIASSYQNIETASEDPGAYTITGPIANPETLTYAVLPNAIKPTVVARDSLSGRTLTIEVVSSTGDPAPSFTLTALTNGGADVLGDQTGTDPWTYVVPDSSTADDVAWTVEASNSGGTWTSSGVTSLPANLFAPSILTAPSITTGGVHPESTITFEKGTYDGTTPITVTPTLTLNGTDVTGDMVGLQYDIPLGTEGQSLVYSETADNGVSPTETQSFSETITAAPLTITHRGEVLDSDTSWTATDSVDISTIGLVEDDAILAMYSLCHNTTLNPNFFAPSGDSYIKNRVNERSNGSGAWANARFGYKTAGATPNSTIDLAAQTQGGRGEVLVVRGYENVETVEMFVNSNDTLTAVPPSVTPTKDNSMVVVMITVTNGQGVDAVDETGYGTNTNKVSSGGGLQAQTVVAEFTAPTANEQFTPDTLSIAAGATDRAWVAVSFLLTPLDA